MAVAGLIVLALVLLCAGVALGVPLLFVGSLAASVAAAALLYRTRPGPVPDRVDPVVCIVDGRPRYHRPECDLIAGTDVIRILRRQAVDDGLIACSLCEPDAVSRLTQQPGAATDAGPGRRPAS